MSTTSTGDPHGHATHLEGATGGVAGFPDYVKSSPSVPSSVVTDADFEAWCRAKTPGGPTSSTVDLADLAITKIAGCGTTGSIQQPAASNDVTYETSTGTWSGLTGDVTVTAELADPADTFAIPAPGDWTVSGASATWVVEFGEVTDCVYGTLVTPSYTPNAACAVPGSVQALADQGNVRYAIDGGNWAVTDGDHTITATLINNAVAFTNPTLAGWVTSQDGLSATYAVPLGVKTATCGGGGGGNNGGGGGPVTPTPGTPDPQLTLVTPNYPSATEADCSHRGLLVVPPQPAGVLMTRSGTVPGDVTFSFAPATGYAFPAGTDTEVTVTVDKKLSGDDCILGEETTAPKPHGTKSKPKPRDRAPIVLGTQAAVPTAVDAGLAGLPSASVSPISSPRLAQALVAGGLLLLIAGGSMGLGRRTRGAHES